MPAPSAAAGTGPAVITEETMSLKYRVDREITDDDGAVVGYADWMGGPSIARIRNCRWNLAGDPRVNVFVQGEPDTWFSIPAVTYAFGRRIRGYLTSDDDGFLFRHVYY